MKTGKVDRRVKYTKMVLKQSFIKLLGEKNISQISIKEICENADINRATFYAHYSDQYDLMEQIQDELFENVLAYLSEYVENNDQAQTTQKIFDYIKENASLCQLLLSERGDINFQKRITKLLYNQSIGYFVKIDTALKEDAEYIYSFLITGSIGVIQKWLNDGMKKSTRFMSEIILKLASGLMATIPSLSDPAAR